MSHFPKPGADGNIELKTESETKIIPPSDVYIICQEYVHMLKREWYFKHNYGGKKTYEEIGGWPVVRLGDKLIFKPIYGKSTVQDRTNEHITRAHIQTAYQRNLQFKDEIVLQIEEIIRKNKITERSGVQAKDDSIWKSGIDWDEKDSKVYRLDSLGSHTQGWG